MKRWSALIAIMGLVGSVGGFSLSPARADQVPATPAIAPAVGSGFHPGFPTRIVDTRTGLGSPGGPIGPGADRAFIVAGTAGVASTATAVVLNVTVTGGTLGSFLTMHPTGSAIPTASTINFAAGETIANSATVAIGTGQQVSAFNLQGSVQLIVDVVGWYDAGTGAGDLFNGIQPARVLDSRTAVGGWSGPLLAGAANSRTLRVSGGGTFIPATATTAVLNVTVTGATASSFLQVWPTGATRPDTSVLNFGAGQTIANVVTSSIGTGGTISFYNVAGTTDVVVDVLGYFDPSAGARYHAVSPVRVLDDRLDIGASGPWAPGVVRSVAIAGAHDIPGDATAVVANLTATNATSGSNLRVFPHGGTESTTSNLNFGARQTIANALVSRLGSDGAVDIRNNEGFVNVIADVAGWFGKDLQLQRIAVDYGKWYLPGATTPFLTDPFQGTPAPADYDGNGHWEPANIEADGSWVTQGTAGTFSFPPPPAVAPYYHGYYPIAVPADYNGDGKADAAWYRDSDATWFIRGIGQIQFGQGPTDPPIAGNDPSGGNQLDQDYPVPADYDGDGITDLATYRPRTATWKIRRSSDHVVIAFTLGDPTLVGFPLPRDYGGVGHAQPAFFDNVHGWLVAGHLAPVSTFGVGADAFPAPADYLGTGRAQPSYAEHLNYAGGPWPWNVEGAPATVGPAGTLPIPVPLGFGLISNIARFTLVQHCVNSPQWC